MAKKTTKTDMKLSNGCVVLFSGGQDSTACLLWALDNGCPKDKLMGMNIQYGQRNGEEVTAAADIWHYLGLDPGNFCQIDLSALGSITDCLLTGGSQTTNFVPNRNLIFFGMAASLAITRRIYTLVSGIWQNIPEGVIGYPDCSTEFFQEMEKAIKVGNNIPQFNILAPVIDKTKAEITDMYKGREDVLALTLTCYNGQRPGCGECIPCKHRAQGFQENDTRDPSFDLPKEKWLGWGENPTREFVPWCPKNAVEQDSDLEKYANRIETVPSIENATPQICEMDVPFSFISPVTGTPETGCISICMCLGEKVPKTETIRNYLYVFRMVCMYPEQINANVLNALATACDLYWLDIQLNVDSPGGQISYTRPWIQDQDQLTPAQAPHYEYALSLRK